MYRSLVQKIEESVPKFGTTERKFMEITLNKNFEAEYKDDAWRGFSLNEIAVLIAAVIQAGIELYLLYTYVGLEIATAVYIVVPTMIPVLALGFYKYQGMTPLGLLAEMHYDHKTRQLLYSAGELEKVEFSVFHTRKCAPERLSKKERKAMKKVWKKRRR